MPADRTLLPLAMGLLLCCHLCLRIEALPDEPPEGLNSSLDPSDQSNSNTATGPIVQSIFTVPKVCRKGFKLTGDPPHCHKLV